MQPNITNTKHTKKNNEHRIKNTTKKNKMKYKKNENTMKYKKTIKNRIKFINKILNKDILISNNKNTNEKKYPTNIIPIEKSPNDILSYLKKREQLVELPSKRGTFGFPFMACTKKCKDENTEKFAIKLIYLNGKSSEFENINQKKFIKKFKAMDDSERRKMINKDGTINMYFFFKTYDELSPNVELKVINILKKLVNNNITPHINLPIIRFHSDLSLLKKKYSNNFSWASNDKFLNNVNVLVSEWNEYNNLHTYLYKEHKSFMNNIEKWIVLFFQILYTLTTIQIKIPGFKHNDLHMKNILVDSIDKGYYLYRIKLKDSNEIINYKIKSMGFRIKLWDFDYSSIKNRVYNLKIGKLSNIPNKYNDLFFIFYKIFCFEKKTNSHVFRNKIGYFFHDILKYKNHDYVSASKLKKNTKKMNYKIDDEMCNNPPGKNIWAMKNEDEYTTPENILYLHTKNKERGIFSHLIIPDSEIKNTDFIEIYECL